MRVVLVGLVAGACLAACGGGGKSASSGHVTYYQDVLPLVTAHCGGCHAPGGFAPFSLTSYDEARGYAALAAAATQSGEMPPWPPAAGCGDFAGRAHAVRGRDCRVRGVGPGGRARRAIPAPPRPPPAVADDLGAPSVTLDPGDSYRPNAATTDDYHCFLVDPGLSSAQDLIGFNVHPGTPASVHHVLVFAVPPASVGEAQSKDAAEPGLGWTCFAGSGLGSHTDGR